MLAINLDTTIVNVALPTISGELDAGTRQLQWIVDGYNLAFAGLVLAGGQPVGPLRSPARPDRRAARLRRGERRRARWSPTPVPSSPPASAMGAFAALIFPTTLSIISNTFPERRERAAALGVWGAVVGIGVAAGPVVGGLLLEHFAWGSVFWALVPLALLTGGRGVLPGAGVA